MPQGNGFVLAVLRSPAHWLLSRMVLELRYTGRRTGREYVLPLQYAGMGERLVVRPQAAERSTWWRTFRAPTPVTVRVRGRIVRGLAQVVLPHEPAWEQARKMYVSRWRTSSKVGAGPFVVISLNPAGALSDDVSGISGAASPSAHLSEDHPGGSQPASQRHP
jgi:hypothetical protein